MAKPKPLDQLRADIGVRLKQSPVVFLANTNTEKERAETQLAQEQHKLERLENRKKFLEQVIQATISSEMKKITQPSGAATPRSSDAHKRIAAPKAFCVLRERSRPRPKSGNVRRSDTRPGEVCERAERSEGNDSAPSETPLFRRVGRCVRSCWRRRVSTHFRL